MIQWFVQPGATVEEFSPLCEVQSDKASVEITSRFSGTVKKLHYEAGDMASVGRPLVDIDVQGEEDAAPPVPEAPKQTVASPAEQIAPAPPAPAPTLQEPTQPAPKGKCATLATPAVRHLSKELNVDIADIDGTGRDGRVRKEDIYKFVEAGKKAAAAAPSAAPSPSEDQVETAVPLSPTQQQMFKTMTRSLAIPHFLYADEIDLSSLAELRGRLNRALSKSVTTQAAEVKKLSYLPFIIKAVSLALREYPLLNARVDAGTADEGGSKPQLVHRSVHNIGVAMDTPSGLVVPVIRDVASLNVLSIAAELARLQDLAARGRLAPRDMSGGTITVSNIGSVGGTYVSPVIVEREVAILGVGRIRAVPAFAEGPDGADVIVKKQVCNFSWSADHRVVDGATMARAAEVVRAIVEEPDVMVMHLK